MKMEVNMERKTNREGKKNTTKAIRVFLTQDDVPIASDLTVAMTRVAASYWERSGSLNRPIITQERGGWVGLTAVNQKVF